MMTTPRTIWLLVAASLVILLIGCSDDDDTNPITPPVSTTGTILINSSPEDIGATWTLTSTDGFELSGLGEASLPDLRESDYTLVWHDVNHWITPGESMQTLEPDSTLTFIGAYGEPYVTVTLVGEIGSAGTGPGQFDNVSDVAFDPDGYLLVGDYGNDRVQKFNPDLTFNLQFAHASPLNLDTDGAGNVFVWGHWVLYKYDGAGTRLDSFHRLNYSTNLNSNNNFAVSPVANEMTALNFYDWGMIWDNDQNDYVQRYAEPFNVMRVEQETGAYIGILGSEGEEVSQFLDPYFTEYGPTGHLYVLDVERKDIQVFASGGWVETKPMDVNVSSYSGFAIDAEGRMYVRNSSHVTIYSDDGLVSDDISVGTSNFGQTIDTWRDPLTGDDYLAADNDDSVLLYRLEFVGW